MKLKTLLLIFTITLCYSCSRDDSYLITNLQTETKLNFKESTFKFIINPESGEVSKNIPIEILGLLIKDYKSKNDFDKVKSLINTYDIVTGDIKSNAINSDAYEQQKSISPNNKALARPQFRAHVTGSGWLPWKFSGLGNIIGTTGQSKRMEAIEIKDFSGLTAGQAHVSGTGWLPPVYGNSGIYGTTGQSKRMEALILERSTDNYPFLLTKRYFYRAHVQDIGWMAWKETGNIIGTLGQSKRMEAIEIYSIYGLGL